MAAGTQIEDSEIGRFDKSFLIHMIKDFFIILIVVTILEFALKAGIVWYEFRSNGQNDVDQIAAELAENVRSIMLNEGGPVAARTIYPILEQNWSELGYSIAIEPSEVTIASIEELYGFVPQGIPDRPPAEAGENIVGTYDVTAQEFCTSCHTQARVGDVLGTITVRNYLVSNYASWWTGVQVTSGLAVGKIILHSVLLFILLRARMEPLLRLRAVVSNLAKAFGGLDQRAEIRSADEFGVLARDLNLFLNRISGLVTELDRVLRKVIDVNDDILAIQGDMRSKMDDVLGQTRNLERTALMQAKREPMLSEEWFAEFKNSVERLSGALQEEDRADSTRVLEALRNVISQAQAQIRTNETLFQDIADLGSQTESFQSSMSEMIRLEERMKGIIETGSVMVKRLNPVDPGAAE